jgi:hypothetical protein
MRLFRPLHIAQVLALALTATAFTAQAATYKCTRAGGKVEYTDQPCSADGGDKPWSPKQPLNVMSSQAMQGKGGEASPSAPDKRPAWLKPISPVGDCKAKGGTFDPEFRACKLP